MKYKLYHGKNTFLSKELLRSEIENLKEKDPETEILTLEADTLNPEQILDPLSSPSLFAKKRLIIIKRIYKNKKKGDILEPLLELLDKSQSDDILLIWEEEKIRSNTKYYKFFKKENAVEESKDLNKRTFFTWLKKELGENNLEIDSDAKKILAERTNYDAERCANEIQKFKLDSDTNIIKKDAIEIQTADTLQENIWTLIDAINKGEKEISISILEKLYSQSTDPNYILAMLARNLRLIALTKHLVEEGRTSREISSILKIPPFTTPNLIKASKQYTDKKIETMYTKLSNLDHKIKTGKIDGSLGLTLICPYL